MHRFYRQFLVWYHHKADALGARFGFDARYYISGNFWITAQQGIAITGGFITTVAFARILPPETFGAYKYILSLAGIVGIFSLTGMKTALTRTIARGTEELFIPAVRTFALWTIPSALIMLAMSGYYGYMGNYTYMWALGIAAVLQPLWHTCNLYISYLQGKKEFRLLSLYQTITDTTITMILIAAIFITENLLTLIILHFSVNSLLSLFFFLSLYPTKKQRTEISETALFARHLSVAELLTNGTQYVDKILVFQLLGPSELALYTIAVTLPEKIRSSIRANIGNLALPKMAEHESFTETYKLCIKKIPALFILVIIITFVYILTAPSLLLFLFPEYADAISLSQLHALSILSVPIILFLKALNAHQKHIAIYTQNLASGTIRMSCIFLGGIWGGLNGIVIGHLTGYYLTFFASFLIALIIYKKEQGQ
jgi:O-antigen/teichoic acid export membrane protein